MITLRPSASRGHADHGWLKAAHSFSFGDYHDPAWMGFRSLRVINEDRVAPGKGFGAHPHRDMEIITVVLEGELTHGDTIGAGHLEVLRPGEVQRISAGTGMTHSEINASKGEAVHLYQIWITPDKRGHTPRYGQARIDPATRENRLGVLARPASEPEGSAGLSINQDAWVYSAVLGAGRSLRHELAKGRGAWVQVVRGSVRLNGQELRTGDAAAMEDEKAVELTAGGAGAEVLVFDLA